MNRYLCDNDDGDMIYNTYPTYGLLLLSCVCGIVCGAYNAIRFFIGPTERYLEACKGPNTFFAIVLLGLLLLHIVLPIIRYQETKMILKASATGIAFVLTIWAGSMLAAFIIIIILLIFMGFSLMSGVARGKSNSSEEGDRAKYINRPYDDCFGSETLRHVSDDIYQNTKGEEFRVDKYGNAERR